jgi:hypothetical protein
MEDGDTCPAPEQPQGGYQAPEEGCPAVAVLMPLIGYDLGLSKTQQQQGLVQRVHLQPA